MKTFIYSISILVLLSSCSNGGGGSGTSAPAKPLSDQLSEASTATDFTKTVLPNASTVVKANLSYQEQTEVYSVGCKTPGQSESDTSIIDPKLLVGQTFQIQEANSRVLDFDTNQITERKITEVTADKISTEVNLLETLFVGTPFTSIEQVFISKPHIVSSVTYKMGQYGLEPGDYAYNPNFTAAASDYFRTRAEDNTYLSCGVSYDGGSSYTVDKITYQLDTHQITAYKKTDIHIGDVTCEKRTYGSSAEGTQVKMGHGRSESITIVTNETVRDDVLYCGGSDVFRSEKIVLDSGKVLHSEVRKVLSAPLR